MSSDHTIWVAEHFIGGHPALDFSNAVFDRRNPPAHNELFNSARDVGTWLLAAGLAKEDEAGAVAELRDHRFLDEVHEIRESSYELFNAIAESEEPPSQSLGLLFSSAARLLQTRQVGWDGTLLHLSSDQWKNPAAVSAFFAQLSIEAFFTLPRARMHACPRCGWLFVDTSRGGKRRWCNMRICGNREKITRYRSHFAF
ncbi:ABATE domain-containing protein [Rhizobium sp. R634]|uniref:CGNR zinc finger domain-containing protein n=1 Tax=Rhizobium sp. R634 TaxID=1764274 RepID=UPI001FD9AD89|nr:ABATE domain-containing protein [Rhizobium sp. R634]